MSDKPTMPPPGFYAFPYMFAVGDGKGGTYYQYCAGMTMRDYLATAALAHIPHQSNASDSNVAERAYRLADAMLAAREGK